MLPVPKEFKLKKIQVPFEEENPAVEPLFANYFDVTQAGGDVYIDVGIVSPEEMGNAKDGSTVTFAVVSRLAISPSSLALLHGMAGKVLEQLKGNENAISSTPRPTKSQGRKTP